MPLYLIMITKRRWDRLDLPWLGSGLIQADPLGDLRSSDGVLSVWHIEDDRSNLDLVITALASNRSNINKFEYGLFDQNIIANIGIESVTSLGDTKIDDANTWHRDLVNLTTTHAVRLVENIFISLEKKRLDIEELQEVMINTIHTRKLSIDKINKSMKKELLSLVDKA